MNSLNLFSLMFLQVLTSLHLNHTFVNFLFLSFIMEGDDFKRLSYNMRGSFLSVSFSVFEIAFDV